MNFLPSKFSNFLCFILLVFSSLDPTIIFSNAENAGDENEKTSTIKGMFVFGDSFVDTGNNNFIDTIGKADYLPYGMDSPVGPSGRFSNGKSITDFLGELLNIPAPIPPFHDPSTKGNHSAVGVNFASGASGLLNETSNTAGGVPCLLTQIKKFEEETLPELQSQGESISRESLSKYLFVIGVGTNDYMLNYYMNGSQSHVPVQDFTANLTTTLYSRLEKLYNLGAQKFVIVSLVPLGCSPMSTAVLPRKVCNKYQNEAASLFNANVKAMVKGIMPQKPGPNVVVVNAYKITRHILRNPALYGFTDVKQPCCEIPLLGSGKYGILCKNGGSTCEDRNKKFYFDGLHPTEAVNVVLATKAFSSNHTTEVYPYNIQKLIQI